MRQPFIPSFADTDVDKSGAAELSERRMRSSSTVSRPSDAAFGADFPDAAWIWTHGEGRRYNDWARFATSFEWDGASPVTLALTADSSYRLWVNGAWAGDGPVRGWPEHYYFDERRLDAHLKAGRNTLRVLVQHYGSSSFHIVPQQGGFRAALRVGDATVARTGDGSWQAADTPERPREAPRIAVQMPPMEIVDARANGDPAWREPVGLDEPTPWTVDRRRDVAEPATAPVPLDGTWRARRIEAVPAIHAVPILQLLHPGRVREATQRNHACALAAVAEVEAETTFRWRAAEWDIAIDGERLETGEWRASPGRHRVLAVYRKL